jgi:glycosyltransferase involved in cell wall biosynthesis
MPKQPQKLAFVVATKDRREDLRRMLKSLSEQSFHPDQVIIVDASSESVELITEEFCALNIKYIRHPRPSASKQRNVGITAVAPDMDLVGFLDDDIEFEPGAIEAMLAFWQQASVDVGGCAFNLKNFEPTAGAKLKQSSLAEWLGLYSRVKGAVMPSGWQTLTGTVSETTFVQWLPSCASVWRSAIFERFKFDEHFDGYSYLEDLDFSFSVGKHYRLAVLAEAGFYHYISPSGRISQYEFGKIEVANRLYIVKKHRLSVPHCYLGLLARFLITLVSIIRQPRIPKLQRAAGNFAGLARSLSLTF